LLIKRLVLAVKSLNHGWRKIHTNSTWHKKNFKKELILWRSCDKISIFRAHVSLNIIEEFWREKSPTKNVFQCHGAKGRVFGVF